MSDGPASLLVDTPVWMSAMLTHEPQHAESVHALTTMRAHAVPVILPDIVRLELACGIARRAGARAAAEVLDHVLRWPGVRLLSVDGGTIDVAIRLGTASRLRSMDAWLVALARVTGATLVTWDGELRQRAGALSPAEWALRPVQ
ncbi:MAG: PIN domain-containing protein [Gemmatimonadaceae bacterium]|nr:PIN domain-containing protein [Gemmatimonadaceae bacterium]